MKRTTKLLLTVITVLMTSVFSSCNASVASATENKTVPRYDAVFDVKGPVKSVEYSVTRNFNELEWPDYVARVEYTPQGYRWNIIANDYQEIKYFEPAENGGLNVIYYIGDGGSTDKFTYVIDPLKNRLKSFDGLKYIYENNVLSKVQFTFNNKPIFKVKDSGTDAHGNWTIRELTNGSKKITIKRKIDYYTESQIPKVNTSFDGKKLKEYEIVGDFNGDGKLEKAWVKGVENFYEDDNTPAINLRLEFSDSNIKPVQLGKGFGFSLYNVGDINGDGCDDIGMTPWTMSSAWITYHVLGSTKGVSWKQLTSFTIREELLDYDRGEGFIPIMRKDNGDVEICEAHEGDDSEEDDFVLYYYQVRTVNIKK